MKCNFKGSRDGNKHFLETESLYFVVLHTLYEGLLRFAEEIRSLTYIRMENGSWGTFEKTRWKDSALRSNILQETEKASML